MFFLNFSFFIQYSADSPVREGSDTPLTKGVYEATAGYGRFSFARTFRADPPDSSILLPRLPVDFGFLYVARFLRAF